MQGMQYSTFLSQVKDHIGVKYSYLLEMRPDRSVKTDLQAKTGGFFLDESELLPVAKETWEAMKVVAEAVLAHSSIPIKRRF